jgi:hypothetical protein
LEMVKTLKFRNFDFFLEGMRCFNILRLQELGVGLDGFLVLVLGVSSLGLCTTDKDSGFLKGFSAQL